MENERLKEQPIASVKAIFEYASRKLYGIQVEMNAVWTDDSSLKKEDYDYWKQVVKDCEDEIEFRIKQIFP